MSGRTIGKCNVTGCIAHVFDKFDEPQHLRHMSAWEHYCVGLQGSAHLHSQAKYEQWTCMPVADMISRIQHPMIASEYTVLTHPSNYLEFGTANILQLVDYITQHRSRLHERGGSERIDGYAAETFGHIVHMWMRTLAFIRHLPDLDHAVDLRLDLIQKRDSGFGFKDLHVTFDQLLAPAPASTAVIGRRTSCPCSRRSSTRSTSSTGVPSW